MKEKIGMILLLAIVLSLAGCGGRSDAVINTEQIPLTPAASDSTAPLEEETPAVSQLPLDLQRQVLESNRNLWAFTDPYNSPWFYTFTDLDHNGRLEVIAATTQGTGIYTYGHLWEVLSDGTGIRNCYHENTEIEGPDDWPEIVVDSLPCYYDTASDCYYYPCEGITRDGWAYQYYAWYALCLKDGIAEWELLADKQVSWENVGENESVSSVLCSDAAGNPITEQEYDTAAERRFAGMEKTESILNWTQEEIPWPESSDDDTSLEQGYADADLVSSYKCCSPTGMRA